jgi:hypothetical protein
MKRKLTMILFVIALILAVSATPVYAEDSDDNPPPPPPAQGEGRIAGNWG